MEKLHDDKSFQTFNIIYGDEPSSFTYTDLAWIERLPSNLQS